MIQKLREKGSGEGGFTLVELLVVMLILGLLAAIAIPSFFDQRDKAKDADAKADVRTAQTAMETYATDHQGSYSGADRPALENIENTLVDAGAMTVTTPAAGGYSIAVTSDTGNVFSIARADTGSTSLTCTTPDTAGCPSNGSWG